MNKALNDPHPAKNENQPEQEVNTELIFKPLSFEVKSSTDPNKIYTVTNFRPNHWSCDCPGFRYNCHDKEGYRIPGKFCKHILKIKQETGRA
jgi:hypothetical protein